MLIIVSGMEVNLLSSKYMNGNKNIINISHQLIDCVPTEALTVKNDINEVILKTYNLYHANENLYKLITNIDTIKKYIKINLNAVNHNRKDIINKIKKIKNPIDANAILYAEQKLSEILNCFIDIISSSEYSKRGLCYLLNIYSDYKTVILHAYYYYFAFNLPNYLVYDYSDYFDFEQILVSACGINARVLYYLFYEYDLISYKFDRKIANIPIDYLHYFIDSSDNTPYCIIFSILNYSQVENVDTSHIYMIVRYYVDDEEKFVITQSYINKYDMFMKEYTRFEIKEIINAYKKIFYDGTNYDVYNQYSIKYIDSNKQMWSKNDSNLWNKLHRVNVNFEDYHVNKQILHDKNCLEIYFKKIHATTCYTVLRKIINNFIMECEWFIQMYEDNELWNDVVVYLDESGKVSKNDVYERIKRLLDIFKIDYYNYDQLNMFEKVCEDAISLSNIIKTKNELNIENFASIN